MQRPSTYLTSYVLTTDSDETKRLVNSMREGLAGAGWGIYNSVLPAISSFLKSIESNNIKALFLHPSFPNSSNLNISPIPPVRSNSQRKICLLLLLSKSASFSPPKPPSFSTLGLSTCSACLRLNGYVPSVCLKK